MGYAETITHTQPVSKSVPLCDILVHLDGTPEDEIRLAHAEALANLDGARITGLLTTQLSDSPYFMDGLDFVQGVADDWSRLDLKIREAGAKSFEKLVERFGRLSVPNEVRRVEEVQTFLNVSFAREALWTDLVVASNPYPDNEASRWDSLIEAAMFNGAHGIYLVPYGVAPRNALRSVMICWNGTREAARAVSEAMPLLSRATQVTVVCVADVDTAQIRGPEAMMDIARHLANHGLSPEITMLPAPVSTADALLDEAHRISADLMVMGVFGHSRFREWLIGGTTVDLLRKSDLPILVAR